MDDILDQGLFDEKKSKLNKHEKLFFIFLAIQTVGSILAIIVSWIEIESIVASGPLLSFSGIITLTFAKKANIKYGKRIGISPLLVTIFWFSYISNSNWSPSDAHMPVNVFLSFTLIITLCFVYLILKRYKELK